jgi:hypothetical protein
MFFRRSVLNLKEFFCKFDGNCDTTKGGSQKRQWTNPGAMLLLFIFFEFRQELPVLPLWRLRPRRIGHFADPISARLWRDRPQAEAGEQAQGIATETGTAGGHNFCERHRKGGRARMAVKSGIVSNHVFLPFLQSFSNIIELVEFNKCLDHLLLAERQATKLRSSPNNLILEYLCGKSLADLLNSQMNVLNFVDLFTMVSSKSKFA